MIRASAANAEPASGSKKEKKEKIQDSSKKSKMKSTVVKSKPKGHAKPSQGSKPKAPVQK